MDVTELFYSIIIAQYITTIIKRCRYANNIQINVPNSSGLYVKL